MKTTASPFIPMMNTRPFCWILSLVAAAGWSLAACGADATVAAPTITVASYYFGQYHPNDPRNEKVKGKGWSEWELVKAAKPRFPGHEQPKVPLWGHTDESDPRVMAQKIAAAADHGIHAFIFDWYYYDVWVHHVGLPKQATDYDVVRDAYFAYWETASRRFDVPYFPNVSMGWDPSPRCDQSVTFDNSGYPFTNTIKNNTPERFRTVLEMARRRLLAQQGGPRILNINCWNEWTEGSYLEPDTVHGLKYLEAVREVFGSGPPQ